MDKNRAMSYEIYKIIHIVSLFAFIPLLVLMFFLEKNRLLQTLTGLLSVTVFVSGFGLMGNLFGKKKFLPNKSYVGSFTCFFVGFLIYYYFFFSHGLMFSLIMALSVFLAEMLSDTGIDDNLLVPVITSIALYIFLQII